MAPASTDVSGSVSAVSYGDRDLGADASMKGYHATTQVFSATQVFALILLTLDAWKRMQLPELAEEGREAGIQENNMSEVCVLYYFWGATRIGTHRVGAALRAVPAQGRFGLLTYAYFIRLPQVRAHLL